MTLNFLVAGIKNVLGEVENNFNLLSNVDLTVIYLGPVIVRLSKKLNSNLKKQISYGFIGVANSGAGPTDTVRYTSLQFTVQPGEILENQTINIAPDQEALSHAFFIRKKADNGDITVDVMYMRRLLV